MIVTSKENKDWLQKTFGCSRSSITMALRFENNSLLARRIRFAAMSKTRSYFVGKEAVL